jgi:hypothetical protein
MHPLVSRALQALHASDRAGFLVCFAPGARLTDDGRTLGLLAWSDEELFGAQARLQVHAVDRTGLELTGRFESSRWQLNTVWRFSATGDAISALDVVAT